DISVAGYEKLIKDLPGIKLIGSSGGPDILGNIRKIKDRKETDVMRRAARITVKIWKKIKKNITTGMTEKDIAAMIDMHIRSRGCLNAFPTIAAVGKNTAYPHAVPTSRRLKDNEHVLVDFGVRYKGYCSDLTRICLNGRIDRQIMGFRDHVRKAHDLAIKTAKDGVRIDTVCGKVRKVFQDANLGDFLLHGLGHGIGVEVHERPFLRLGCPEKLKKGMVITIEPDLYREGLGGVREEDMILITEKGCEVLTL
ncbi:MAG: Xaa-Pro peptidase family protein, partial [Candidatus Omnitrophica bacterium]|nr:Xaa-Pro peptidase family protein [Candidatus Omnitrophota bacterium]